VPNWLLGLITTIMVIAWLAATWTLAEGLLNHRAVKGIADLREVTHRAVLRLAGLETIITMLVLVSVLSLPIPRPPAFRLISSLALVLMALAVAGLCFREFLDMKQKLKNGNNDQPPQSLVS